MSYCMKYGNKGKDHVIFVTKEDHGPPTEENTQSEDKNGYEEDRENLGRSLPNGEINWDCACRGGIPYGPCGPQYRTFSNCIETYGMYSEACVPPVMQLGDCFKQYPDMFKRFLSSDDNDEEGDNKQIDKLDEEEKDERINKSAF